MRKLSVFLLALMVATLWADHTEKRDVKIDISKDSAYSGCFFYNGGQIGIKAPTRTASTITLECVDADLKAGGLPEPEGIVEADYKLKLYCAETSYSVTKASDSSSSANDFTSNTSTGMMSTASGVGGYGFALDGDTWMRLYRADDADFDASTNTAFVIAMWAKHNTASAADTLWNKRDGTGNTQTGYTLAMDASGDYYFEASSNGGVTVVKASTSAVDYDDNAWHFVTAVRDTSKNLYLYVDGIGVSNVASAAPGTLENSAIAYIGATNATAAVWTGSLDSVVFIKDKSLTAVQVRNWYNDAYSARVPASVYGWASTASGTGDEFIEATSYLYGYRGWLRIKSSAAQAADRVFTVYCSDR